MQHCKSRQISQCLELAITLEASAHKPGNVSIVTNFENTGFEHFLASSVAAAPFFELAAQRGTALAEGKSTSAQIELGQLIKDCVAEIDTWQHGGNTLLGTIILLSPIAVAAGMASVGKVFNLLRLRKSLKLVIESTTPADAVNLYEAIKIANPGGLGKAPDLDINDPASEARILGENVSLFQVFKIAEKYDTICSEWVNNYPATFDMAYPSMVKKLGNGTDLNEAIIHTYLEVLANVPDTFIARKVGLERSRKVSANARKVLDLGGLKTASGTKSLHRFDQQLRRSNNLLNPGTTADIIGAALSLCVLRGYRP
jgi:triphosphoribosyl-dephospho-CoA synthase